MTLGLTGRGRPFRFLALVAIGWIGLRIALLWPQTGSLPEAVKAVLAPEAGPEPAAPLARAARASASEPPRAAAQRRVPAIAPDASILDPPSPQTAIVQVERVAGPAALPPVSPTVPTRFNPSPSRWSGSAWLMVRGGSGIGAAPGGQIGGSQGGARITYVMDRRRRVALFGRFVTPLAGRGREATIGIEWQPVPAPVRLVAEYRVPADGGRAAPGAALVAGVDRALPGGFRLESYGQAGAIRRDRIEPYADGAVRAARTIPGTPVALGAGAWGAAQRGATRLDIGPSAALALPIGRQQVRVALDWRQRVAGDARPGSGLALTLGSDF